MTRQELEQGLYKYRAVCRHVVDGDTLDLDIDMGLFIQRHERIRLYGINAPEIKGASKIEGLKATDFVKSMVCGTPVAPAPLWVETFLDKSEKYGRLLAKVWYEDKGTMVCLNDELCRQKLAEPRSY